MHTPKENPPGGGHNAFHARHFTTAPPELPDFEQIPADLKVLPQWVCWRLAIRDGIPVKIPKSAHTGRNASTTKPADWCDFETAVTAYQQGGFDGIGFVFTRESGIVGIDLDECIDADTGELAAWAQEVVVDLDSYTEVSPSGRGLHAYVVGMIPQARKKGSHASHAIEIYDKGRYFTVTGRRFTERLKVEERQEALTRVYTRAFGNGATSKPAPTTRPAPAPTLALDDTALIDKAMAASNGAKFRALWNGDTWAYGGDDSAADLALCSLLAFWTQREAGRMDRLFRQSGLMRPKWERDDYRQRTLDKAIAECQEVYSERRRTGGNGHDTELSTQTPLDPDPWPRLEPEDKPPHLCTDQANGYRIARHLGHDLLYVVRIGWHSWRETHWRLGEEFAYRKAQKLSRLILEEAATITKKGAETEDSERRKKLMEIAEALTKWAAKNESCGTVYSAMTLAKPLLTIEHSELDRDTWLLNCVNGILDLRAGTLRPHRRADFITRCIPVAYAPQATCPTWLTFLDRIFSSNRDLIHFVQKAIGYTLTADTSEQCVFFLWGGGQNGKSTLLSTVQAMMGAYAQQAAPDLLVVSKHERHTTEIAELRGARLVASIETGEGRRLNEPLIKQMSGGDRMKGRFMRQDNIEFDPTHKVFLATNHKPVIRGADYAIWRRIRLIPFTVTIPPEERDQKFPEKLKAELPGILAWAVQGCLAWQQEGLEPPKEVIEATDQYKAESDVLAAFMADRCVIDAKARVTGKALYDAYKEWCLQVGESAESNTGFGLRLGGLGYQKRRGAAGVIYDGIGLRATEYEMGEI